MADRVVVGGTVAALATADGLAAAGHDVRLLVPERGIGGGFRALERDGRRLELGVRLLELGYEDDDAPVPPLADYAPGIAGHRPYARLVRGWVEDLAGDLLAPIAPPEMVLDGRRAPDVVFTVDLHGLRDALDEPERRRIAAEATIARAVGGDAGVLAGPLDRDLTLQDASLRNHGATFHARVIAPLAAKFVPGGAAETLATWRRKAWMPLFWPRTLAEAASGAPIAFQPRRPFHTLAPGGTSVLLDRLLERLRANPRVEWIPAGAVKRVERGPCGRTRLRFDGGHVEDARRPVVGIPAPELLSACGSALTVDRVRTAIAWFEAREKDLDRPVDLLHVHDADCAVARISTGGMSPEPGTRIVAVELRHDLPEDRIVPEARAGLHRTGVLLNAHSAVPITSGAMPTFPVPDAATRRAYDRAAEDLAARELDVELVGPALDPSADSLNEQVVQALRAVERLT